MVYLPGGVNLRGHARLCSGPELSWMVGLAVAGPHRRARGRHHSGVRAVAARLDGVGHDRQQTGVRVLIIHGLWAITRPVCITCWWTTRTRAVRLGVFFRASHVRISRGLAARAARRRRPAPGPRSRRLLIRVLLARALQPRPAPAPRRADPRPCGGLPPAGPPVERLEPAPAGGARRLGRGPLAVDRRSVEAGVCRRSFRVARRVPGRLRGGERRSARDRLPRAQEQDRELVETRATHCWATGGPHRRDRGLSDTQRNFRTSRIVACDAQEAAPSSLWSVYDIGGRKFVTPLFFPKLWYGLRSLVPLPRTRWLFVYRTACEPFVRRGARRAPVEVS